MGNGDLLNNIGNFAHRVLDFIGKRCNGVVPSASSAGIQECLALGQEIKFLVDAYIHHLENARLREALKAAVAISTCGITFLSTHAPWKKLATHPEEAGAYLACAAGVVRLLAALLAPFIPTVAGL